MGCGLRGLCESLITIITLLPTLLLSVVSELLEGNVSGVKPLRKSIPERGGEIKVEYESVRAIEKSREHERGKPSHYDTLLLRRE